MHSQPSPEHRTATIARRAEVQEFLDRLARALVTGDAKAVARMWEVPAAVFGIAMVKALDSLDEVEAFASGVKTRYNARGITHTRAEVVDDEWIGERIVIVKVRWPLLDAGNRELGAEASDYTLRRDDAGQLKVRAVLVRESTPGTN